MTSPPDVTVTVHVVTAPTPTPTPIIKAPYLNDLLRLALCYTFSFSCITLVVGNSTVAYTKTGGTESSAPLTIGVFFLGSSVISLWTKRIFQNYGRRIGFIVGNVLGVLGAVIGVLAIVMDISVLVIVASFPMYVYISYFVSLFNFMGSLLFNSNYRGMSSGIGLYLRFAAMDLVPKDQPQDKAFALTLVLSGGCISAFLGPEAGELTKDLFGADLTYLGMYLAVAIFNILGISFMSKVTFPTIQKEICVRTMKEIMSEAMFLESSIMSALSWIVMAMPMAVLRVAMRDLGFSSRESLLVLEGHFFGMFSPGLISGKIIQKFGANAVGVAGALISMLGLVSNLLVSENRVDWWVIGLILVGIGWNFAFSAATMLLARSYQNDSSLVQASNDFLMFGLAGCAVVSSGYIYDAAGSEVKGWRVLNIPLFFLLLVLLAIPAKGLRQSCFEK